MGRFTGLIGIVLILGIAFLCSNNKKRINLRLVLSGLGLQLFIALMVFKVPAVNHFFQMLGKGMQIGGIGALAPERRGDLAKLGMRALLCGTLASYLSATIAGMLV